MMTRITAIIIVSSLFLVTSCTDTTGSVPTPPATALSGSSAASPTVINALATDTLQPATASTPEQTHESSQLLAEIYSNAEYGYSIGYPDFLNHTTKTSEGIGGVVTIDQWAPADESYAIFVLSYQADTQSGLEFIATVQADETTQIAGLEVRKLTGREVITETGTLIHIGPVSHNGKDHMLVYTSGSQVADPGSLEIFEQMLDSFHLTN